MGQTRPRACFQEPRPSGAQLAEDQHVYARELPLLFFVRLNSSIGGVDPGPSSVLLAGSWFSWGLSSSLSGEKPIAYMEGAFYFHMADAKWTRIRVSNAATLFLDNVALLNLLYCCQILRLIIKYIVTRYVANHFQIITKKDCPHYYAKANVNIIPPHKLTYIVIFHYWMNFN